VTHECNSTFELAVATAKKIFDETGFPPALHDRRLRVQEFAWKFSEPDADSLAASLPAREAVDVSKRAVCAAILYELTPSLGAEHYGVPSRPEVLSILRRHLAQIPVKDLEASQRARWEIHAAAYAQDLSRVLSLARRLEELGWSTAEMALLARTLFILVHPSAEPEPFWFDHEIADPTEPLLYPLSDLLVFGCATAVVPRGTSAWKPPSGATEHIVRYAAADRIAAHAC